VAGQERNESATPRRREEARRRGQTARSAEITAVGALLLGTLFVRSWGVNLVDGLAAMLRGSLRNLSRPDLTVDGVIGGLTGFSVEMALMVGPIFAVMIVIGVVANLAQTGFLLTLHPLKPDFSRVNPLEGAKRLFATRSLIELGKSFLKLGVVGYALWRIVEDRMVTLILLPTMAWQDGVATVVGMSFDIVIWAGSVLFALALIDYGYQRFSFEKSLRMSREEIKEEFKQSEGNPVIKQRVRQLQRAVAQRRMMQAVPKADVVITNPTHFAIAIQYDPATMRAPRVIAKGQDLIAQQIKKVAAEHGVPTMENPPLARALYKACEVGHEIPAEMYAAVAELLAFVYRIRTTRLQAVGAPI
jgi:flagellar biosynthetic protein FlhB